MKLLILFIGVLLALSVCFAIKKHKHKKNGRGAAENELEQLNILLRNIEAYGKNTSGGGRDGEKR